AQDVHLELPGRRGGVDALGEADECDAERLEILQQGDQVLQISPEPIEPPAHDHVELAPPGIAEEPVEAGATIFRPAHASVDVLHGRPAPSGDVAPDFRELV